jgi:hypothetical protein
MGSVSVIHERSLSRTLDAFNAREASWRPGIALARPTSRRFERIHHEDRPNTLARVEILRVELLAPALNRGPNHQRVPK